ncbi:anti-anti-sigma factor [Actinoplanes lutulentus]|uniref:Anti-anti-sigma factor n=2 Tax=Actinoplanes lutulentus TaxID=1287878 RepID=A0A327ZFZ8_9ACTN|nr:anti-anti-sigma factor [Actinoplanes lutulentus]
MSSDIFLGGTPLTVEIRRDTPSSSTVIALIGEVDRDSCSKVLQSVGQVLRDGNVPLRIRMDLAEVTFLDSAGIRTLLHCRRDATRTGCEFGIDPAHENVYQVIEISGLVEVFKLPPRA